MRTVSFAALVLLGALLVSDSALGRDPRWMDAASDFQTTVSATEAPAGIELRAVRWVRIATPGVGVMLAAVARPDGSGPFPAVLILHGSHGFAREYVHLAQDLASDGIVGVAACWFRGGTGAGLRFITPIECPKETPSMTVAASPAAFEAVSALMAAVGGLAGVRPAHVGLFGHSRGGGAALNYILRNGPARGAVLHSTGYPEELATRVTSVNVPILIQHGTADSPADGGSALTDVQRARDFEGALRRAGKRVEAAYYAGGEHNGFFADNAQRTHELQRMRAFLKRHLVE